MGGELRRSYTQMDFSLNRVNIRPHMHHIFQSAPMQDPRRRYSAMPANKVKHPTLDIYRPPSIRPRQDGFNGMAATQRSLNVHAPEFTMNPIQTSRSTSSMMMNVNGFGMMGQGFTRGHQGNGKGHVVQPHPMGMGLQMSKSSGNVLHHTHVVAPNNINQTAPRAVHFQEPMVVTAVPKPSGSGLKRSKSLTATDTLRASTSPIFGQSADMGQFTPEVQADLQQAIQDPNELSARSLMTLAKQIVERATNDRRYAEPAAKICINVIEKEQKETFLESLINTCQLSYQERDRVLRANPSARRYRQYMTFLNEMYVQLKRSQLQLKTQYDGVPPQKLLLTLLSKCFVDCLQAKPLFKIEIESIFFILTSIGKDLEQELPKAMEQIYFNIRDAFLAPNSKGTESIKSTLLQLIELRASKWQMPASAVMYYYPGAR